MFTTAPDFTRTAIAALGTVFFAGVCLFGATAPAAAAEPVAQTVTVAYGDLNLASTSGRNALDARIAQAARSVCFDGGRDVASHMSYNRCVKAAVADAREQADAAMAS
jgi:UrcA family protein